MQVITMSFAEAKAVAKKNPGALLTRDGGGDHIVKNREGELLYSPTLTSRSDEVGDLSQPKGKEPAVKTKKRLLDPFVTALTVGVSDLQSRSVDPLLAQAIQATSSRPIEVLLADPEAAQGAINAAKGKYFELMVKQDLEQGVEYDGFALETNGSIELAEALNQPGWDLQILDADRAVVDVLQLKATDSAAYLRQTLEKYPDIEVMATEEVAALEEFEGTVIDSGISNTEITADATTAVYGSNPDFLDVFSPVLPLVFILATEGVHVALGKETEQHFAERFSERAKHAVTGTAVGAVFVALGFGTLAIIPAFLAAREGPEGLIDVLRDLARPETTEEAQERRSADAKRLNELREAEGLAPIHTPETVPDTNLTGVRIVDNLFHNFLVGWTSASDPELVERRRRENEARIKEISEAQLRKYDQ
jgi:hypothetical protein